jgi:apolipoprotein N-acyltransferase
VKLNNKRDTMKSHRETSSLAEPSITLRIVLLCAFSAVLYALASPRPNLHFLCWVLLLPLLEALEGLRLKRGFLTGWLCGTMMHLVCFYWVVGTVQRYSNLDIWLSILVWILFAIYSGLAFGLMATLFLFLRKGRSLPNILLLPACYTAMEFAFPFVFPWHLGAGLYRVVPAIQIADLAGVYGVTALIVAVNVGLWELLGFFRRKRAFPWLSFTTATALVAATLFYGFWRIASVEQQQEAAPDLDVGLVQANVLIEERRSRTLQEDIWRRYRRLSDQAVHRGAELILWPESAVHFAYRPEAGAYSSSGFLRKFVRSLDRPLLFGSWAVEQGDPRNRAYLLGPDGTLAGRYDKVQLLAFGEYMPFSNWIPQLKGLVEGVGDFRPGEKIEPLCWEDTCFGVLICFEAILKPISREFVDKGAEFLVNITNDAWFGDTSCPEQHLMLSAFRAVENRTWLVRVANTGISAFVDPVGHILHRTAVFEQAVRVCRIDRMEGSSFYGRWGDWLPVSCLVFLGLLAVGRQVKRARGGAF